MEGAAPQDMRAQLPIEILLYICELACYDGYNTGRTLRSASRGISSLIEKTHLLSLSLSGGHAVESFSLSQKIKFDHDTLELHFKRPSHVRHLFLCDGIPSEVAKEFVARK